LFVIVPGAALGADFERQRPGGVPWHVPPTLDSRRWSVQHVAIVTWCNWASVSSRIPVAVRAGERQVTASYRSLDLDTVNGHNGLRHDGPLFEFIAEKQPFGLRFSEAASRDRVQPTLKRLARF
jgi:hypothetical protein